MPRRILMIVLLTAGLIVCSAPDGLANDRAPQQQENQINQSSTIDSERPSIAQAYPMPAQAAGIPPGRQMTAPGGQFYQMYAKQPAPPIMPAGNMLVSTTSTLPGYRIVQCKGIVRGDVVFGPTIFQSFKASFKQIIGGKIGSYSQMCQKARLNAYDDMIAQARELGANAVIGVQYDSSTFSTSNSGDIATEMFCCGTAVVAVPARQ